MSEYIAGLDLGQLQDYTALAVLERQGNGYHCRHLQRYKLGTKYNRIVDHVAGLVRSEALAGKCELVVDHTGVGTAVFDMFTEAGLRSLGVSIHGGDKVSRDGRLYRVPKRDLVGVLQVLLQNGRLKVADSLPEAPTFIAEALNFRVKISDAGHDSYAAWREGDHDDLVLAVALAAWYGERSRPGQVEVYEDWEELFRPSAQPHSRGYRELARVHNDTIFHRRWSRRHYCAQCAERFIENGGLQ